MDTYIADEGYNYTQKYDLTSMTSDQAFDWSYSNYFRAETSRNVVATVTTGSTYGTGPNDMISGVYDYFIANKVFVFNCSNSKNSTLLNSTNYPQGTPVMGMTYDEGPFIDNIHNLGYPMVMAYGWNWSVTSAFTSDYSNYKQQHAPVAKTIDPNGVYLSFMVSDGDNMGAPLNYHTIDRLYSEHSGQVPIGWTFNPLLMDIDPKLAEFTSRQYPDVYENILDSHDGTQGSFQESKTPTGYNNFFNKLKSYGDNMHFYSYNDLSTNEIENYAKHTAPYFLLAGYTNYTPNFEEYYAPTNSLIKGLKIGYQGNFLSMANDIRSNSSGSGPVFLGVDMNSGRNGTNNGREEYTFGDTANKVYQITQNLLSNPQGKNYYFLTPKDWAATWKLSKGYISSPGTPYTPDATDTNWLPPMPLPRSGWTITTSNNQSDAHLMTDANLDSKWSTYTTQTPGQYVQIDLGSAQTFNKFTMEVTNSIGDYPSAYSVYVSNDGINWGSEVASGVGYNEYTLITFPKTTSRYVKIVQTGTNSAHYWSIHELNLYNFDGTMLAPQPSPSLQLNTNTFSKIEAESFDSSSGGIAAVDSSEGGQSIGGTANGSYAVYKNIDFGVGASAFSARVSADANSGGNIEVRLDSPAGTLAGTLTVDPTGGNYQTLTSGTTSITGIHDVYLVFKTTNTNVGSLNWFKFLHRSVLAQMEAENYDSKSGSLSVNSTVDGGQQVENVRNGDYAVYKDINFDDFDRSGGSMAFSARVSADASNSGGTIEVRLDSPTGTLAGKLDVNPTGGWTTYQTLSTTINNVSGTHDVYLVFKTSHTYVCNINWFRFDIRKLNSIAITTPQKKLTYYVGESLDLTGMVVTGTYGDGSTNVENITAANVSGFDSSAPAASQTLTVKVGERTATYNVAIVKKDAFNTLEAESFNSKSGSIGGGTTLAGASGGKIVDNVRNGDYAVYNNVDFGSGATSFIASVSRDQFAGGTIEVRLDSATGTLAGTLAVDTYKGWTTYETKKTNIQNISGVHNLYLVFRTGQGNTTGYVCNMDWFKFNADSKVVTNITAPAAVTGLTNGTAQTAEALGLPATVQLVTDAGNVNANVAWDVNASSYDPAVKTEQTFTVSGTVTLPAGVVNPNNVALTTSVSVTVLPAPATPKSTLTGVQQVLSGQTFTLTMGLADVTQSVYQQVYAQDFTLQYDPASLQFDSVTSLKDGFQVIDQKETAPGQLRIVAASVGANVPAQGDLLAIQFKAKSVTQATNTTISVDHVMIANAQGNELQVGGASREIQITIPTIPVDKSLLNATITSAQTKYAAAVEGNGDGLYAIGSKVQLQSAIDTASATANNSNVTQQQVDNAKAALEAAVQLFESKKITADINGGGISIGDLASVAVAFGKQQGQAGWNEKADVNHDGKVDILDLAIVARAILQ
ncbi:carbohydrate-binding protein [Paenibacillus phytorum]